ncbi:MAG: class I SAM-dependent methyltransferase [bacterium]
MISNWYINDGVAAKKLNQAQLSARDSVLNKLSLGTYKYEKVICPVCGNTSFQTLSEKDRLGIPCRVVLCTECGLIQLNPRMTKESYESFYNTEYRLFDSRSVGAYFDKQYQRGKSIFKDIERYSGINKYDGCYVVEIGCGAGGILKYFKNKGCTIKGYDYGTEYLNYGRVQHGLDLECGGIELHDHSLKADIIIYSHTFEHLLEPNRDLSKSHDILNENGLIFIHVPSYKKVLKGFYDADLLRCFQIAHTYYFSMRTLCNLVENNGFELMIGTEDVRCIFRKSDKRNNSYDSDYADAMRCIRISEVLRLIYRILPIYHIAWYAKKALIRAIELVGIKEHIREFAYKMRK